MLKKYISKLFNRKKYLNIKSQKKIQETVVTFKDIKEEYETWLDCYEDVHDDVFFQPRWDKEVYAYAMLDEDHRKRFYN